MEDNLNQKIAKLIISMSDIIVYVVDVNQFATIAKLKAVIDEAKDLIDRTVKFFNKHKEHGIFSEYSLIYSDCWFTYIKTRFREGVLCISGKGIRRTRRSPDRV